MANVLLIIKLGGAAITDKHAHRSVQRDIVEGCVQRIAECFHEELFSGAVLIHGAGSYAHHESKAFDLATSFEKNVPLSAEQMLALTSARHGLQQLNHVVVSHLLEQRVPATYISSFAAESRSSNLGDNNVSTVKNDGKTDDDAAAAAAAAAILMTMQRRVAREAVDLCLADGDITNQRGCRQRIIPVLHGDFVLHHRRHRRRAIANDNETDDGGCDGDGDGDGDGGGYQSSILSGDDIMLRVAEAAVSMPTTNASSSNSSSDDDGDNGPLKVVCIFVSDVKGVFTHDPKNVPVGAVDNDDGGGVGKNKMLRQVYVDAATGQVSNIELEGDAPGKTATGCLPQLERCKEEENQQHAQEQEKQHNQQQQHPPDVTRAMQGKWESAVAITSLMASRQTKNNKTASTSVLSTSSVERKGGTALGKNNGSKQEEGDALLLLPSVFIVGASEFAAVEKVGGEDTTAATTSVLKRILSLFHHSSSAVVEGECDGDRKGTASSGGYFGTMFSVAK